jgi:hypothetical protein
MSYINNKRIWADEVKQESFFKRNSRHIKATFKVAVVLVLYGLAGALDKGGLF